jgi:phospholipid-transporting ATPase
MMIFTNFVPISLMVTLELVKLFQGMRIAQDEAMATGEIIPVVQSSSLNEELGQINYIFSDKTGTLTCNSMEFKKLSVKGIAYGTTPPCNLTNQCRRSKR